MVGCSDGSSAAPSSAGVTSTASTAASEDEGPLASWSPRGEITTETSRELRTAWTNGPASVKPLFVGSDADGPRVAVAAGLDSGGHEVEVAWFVSTAPNEYSLVTTSPVPTQSPVHVLLAGAQGYLYGLAAPGEKLSVAPSEMIQGETGSSPQEFVRRGQRPAQVIVYRDANEVYSTPAPVDTAQPSPTATQSD